MKKSKSTTIVVKKKTIPQSTKKKTKKKTKLPKKENVVFNEVDVVLKKMITTYPDSVMLERVIKGETDKWLEYMKKSGLLETDSFKAGVVYGLYKYLHFMTEASSSKPPVYAV